MRLLIRKSERERVACHLESAGGPSEACKTDCGISAVWNIQRTQACTFQSKPICIRRSNSESGMSSSITPDLHAHRLRLFKTSILLPSRICLASVAPSNRMSPPTSPVQPVW
jgi:hypothetical protein